MNSPRGGVSRPPSVLSYSLQLSKSHNGRVEQKMDIKRNTSELDQNEDKLINDEIKMKRKRKKKKKRRNGEHVKNKNVDDEDSLLDDVSSLEKSSPILSPLAVKLSVSINDLSPPTSPSSARAGSTPNSPMSPTRPTSPINRITMMLKRRASNIDENDSPTESAISRSCIIPESKTRIKKGAASPSRRGNFKRSIGLSASADELLWKSNTLPSPKPTCQEVASHQFLTPKSAIEELPTEILLHIFNFLSAIDLVRIQLVCQKWSHLSRDYSLWRFKSLPPHKAHMRKGVGSGADSDYRVVVLGATAVGKSPIVVRFVQGTYVEKYDPTIEDSYRKKVEVDGVSVWVDIKDTAGMEEFSALRDEYMKFAHGILLIYSITTEYTFEAARKIHSRFLQVRKSLSSSGSSFPSFSGSNTSFGLTSNSSDSQYTPILPPVILVGSKLDLEAEREVTKEQGQSLADSLMRVRWTDKNVMRALNFDPNFYEVSAKTNEGVDELWKEMIRQIDEWKWLCRSMKGLRSECGGKRCVLQ
eukprot:TRINITY_DN1205_c2_g3_i1.p1 TRINITY_DN1205_c2_g3~~TRINITY_DN1205_c2_g3_i1.p1  ORF type:complete len:529 (+),score=96.75 TRINITY_DN1205_c2_g3_i1:7-1593(+)